MLQPICVITTRFLQIIFKKRAIALGIAVDTGPALKALQAYERKARPVGNAIIKWAVLSDQLAVLSVVL